MTRRRTPYRRQYGRRIQLARERAGLTQSQFAELVGMTRSSIANIETGRQANTAEQVVAFASQLNCDPRWLLTGWQNERPNVGNVLPPYEPV